MGKHGRSTPGAKGSSAARAPLPLYSTSPHGRESRSSCLPQLSTSTTPPRRLASVSAWCTVVRKQAGIQYLMRRWRAIPAELQTRFLHDEFLTLPVDTQASITDLPLVRSREAGIAERTAPSDTRCAPTGNRPCGRMPSPPGSPPRTAPVGTAGVGWPPCARSPPSSRSSLPRSNARGPHTLGPHRPPAHGEQLWRAKQWWQSRILASVWSILAGRRAGHACHRRRTFLWVGRF